MEAIVKVIEPHVEFIAAESASEEDIERVHTESHIDHVKRRGLYHISSLAAGGAIQAATIALKEPCFGLIRPPGHHASSNSSWGFCYFNNMAIAIESLKAKNMITTTYILDIDLHYGDGNVNILGNKAYVTILNPESYSREAYMEDINKELENCNTDIIGVSAGFDYHEEDWGGLLKTDDYFAIGKKVKEASSKKKGGCFAILEGGYNHTILGYNVMALIEGLSGKNQDSQGS